MSSAAALQAVMDNSVHADSAFFVDVMNGLSQTQKTLSPKYFYDDLGSHHFDKICELSEYYPYQTELKLLPRVVADIADRFLKPLSIVEFGAGSLLKVRPLLEQVPSVCEFIPIDISGEHLRIACAELQEDFPKISIQPTAGDFTQHVALKAFRGERLGFFPGSTIGNFHPDEAVAFLASAKKTLGKNANMLIGVDTKKSPALLHDAYNDGSGVTAAFNTNILHRINRELDGDLQVDNFEHYAFYNALKGRIEMHLVSRTDQTFSIAGAHFSMTTGESIHSECSYKYTPQEFQQLAQRAGWQVTKTWLAESSMFATYLLEA